MTGWQPIETAPKDGTPCIVFMPGAQHRAGFSFEDRIGEAAFGAYKEGQWAWANDSCSCCWGSCFGEPTHWMPLPPPPTNPTPTKGD